jgi:exopolyphosphatase/guanosine-5'-triphosphate,3'-diphosphate pyrophosphatase
MHRQGAKMATNEAAPLHTARPKTDNGDVFAAVDLGSNSFHMVIARNADGELQVIDRIKEMVRLAAGLDENNNLDEAARRRALSTLRIFGERLKGVAPGNVRVVGTNTLRKAKNARDFMARAEEAIGHRIEIVSGYEEARLVYLGVAHSIGKMAQDKRLVVDIGGGSTELIIGTAFEAGVSESKYMGCVSYSQRFFPDGVITRERFDEAEIAARQELQPSVRRFKDEGWDLAIGASGTIRAIHDIIMAQGLDRGGITRDAMKALRNQICEAGSIDAIALDGLSDRRQPVFPGGLAILMGIFKSLKIDRMIISDGAMREGVLYDLLGRMHDVDTRNVTVAQFAAKYSVDTEHASDVERTALELFDQVEDVWQFGDSAIYRKMLRWAARIHEIGLAISHSGYHKHGSYLVENSDMPGFSRQDQKFLWAMVRSHRRKFKPHRFDSLPEPYPVTAPRLALILRLAVLLNRSRRQEEVPQVKLKVKTSKRHKMKLRFPKGWLAQRPLSRADLAEEKAYLKAAGFKLKYK